MKASTATAQRHSNKPALVATFPDHFSAGMEVRSRGMVVRLQPLGSSGAEKQIENGKQVYHGAYASTDSINAVSDGRSEEFLLLHDAKAPRRFEYDISAVSGVKEISLKDNSIHFKNAQGQQLEIEAPWLVETGGQKVGNVVHWELSYPGGPTQPRLALVVANAEKLHYPVVIDPTWVVANGNLNTARERHTATMLPNGLVLVVGGQGDSGDAASAELYDPAMGIWTVTGSMNTAREWHTATLLANGQVLVAGGSDGTNTLASAELYDPASGTWTMTGSMSTAREVHTATLLSNGLVLVAGGADVANTALPSAELYDPATGLWTTTGSLNTERYLHTATLLPNGDVLVAGGYPDLASAELYNPVTGTWTMTGSLNTGRQAHTATLLAYGKVLVVGGNGISGSLATTELYDPASGLWTATGNLNMARSEHTATLLSGGQVLVAGGDGGLGDMACVESYDPVTGAWTTAGSFNTARENHTATMLPNGLMLVAGGYDSGFLASVELYNPATSPGSQAAQTILAFATIPTQTIGTAPFAITPPTATSGLPVMVTVQSGPATISGNTLTVTSTGTVVLAADQMGNAAYSPAPEVTTRFEVVSPNISFTQWEAQYSLSGGPTDSPVHDGVSNQIKYLLDINPSRPMNDSDKAALPSVGTSTLSGVKCLTLTYRQRATLTGVVVTPQVSTDLQSWNAPGTGSQTVQIGTDAVTGDPIMQVQVPASGPMMFIRLSLTGS